MSYDAHALSVILWIKQLFSLMLNDLEVDIDISRVLIFKLNVYLFQRKITHA